jgi:competence protein ComEC
LLAWLALAVIGGIAASASSIEPELASGRAVLFAISLLCPLLVTRRTARWMVMGVIIAGLLLGLWRGESQRLKTADYPVFIGRQVQLHGAIADDITKKAGAMGLKLRDVQIDRIQLGGQVWASVSTSLPLKRGDKVVLNGTLRPGFGSYAASMSFAKVSNAIRRPIDPIRAIRDKFNAGLEKTVPQPEAALAIGYLTGQHNLVPDTLVKQMQITGLIHLVIAGGYNVTILVRLVRRLGSRVAKRLAACMSIAVLLTLALAAGFVAPMARTTTVTGLSLAAWYYGRWPHPLVLLPVAAGITALIDPYFVWGDVGWYMTFIAYGGLIVLGPMLKEWWWGEHHSGEIKQIIVDTIAVQIVTMPLMAYAFQQYSVYGLPANLLVLPLMSLTMIASLAAGLAGMALPLTLAHIVAWPAIVLLGYTRHVTVWMAAAPGADFGGSLSITGLILAYLLVVFFVCRLKRKIGYDFRSENLIE